jgi:hypothetical protein
MMKLFQTGFRIFALMILTVLISFLVGACVADDMAPIIEDEQASFVSNAIDAQKETTDSENQIEETENNTSDATVVPADYDGADPETILQTYCAISGCHTLKSLQIYSDSVEAMTAKIESMCGTAYSDLPDAQTQSLLDHYLNK